MNALFNRNDRFAEGWYWALRSSELPAGSATKLNLLGRELALYRGADGRVAALDAFCPHMGAHLGEGLVEGDKLRCLFHGWSYGADGRCAAHDTARTASWPVEEEYGLIWVWTGPSPRRPLPYVPELAETETASMLGGAFEKGCHPNVVMINAIDAHHFNTVHHLPVRLEMEPVEQGENNIWFRNTTRVPSGSALTRFIGRFYAGPLTYWMSYWYGSTGTVTLGPDFLHCHIMFALRATPDGKTQGQTVLITRRRRGPLGWLLDRVILLATKLVGDYFAHGDTKIFRSIRFELKNPVPADAPISRFIAHLDAQTPSPWCAGGAPRPVEAA